MAKKVKQSTGGLFTEETKPIPVKEIELSVVPAKVDKVAETGKETPTAGIIERRDWTDYGVLPEEQRLKLFPNKKPPTLRQLKKLKNNRG